MWKWALLRMLWKYLTMCFRFEEDMECRECDYVYEKYTIKTEYYHENKDYDVNSLVNGEFQSYWGNIAIQYYKDKDDKWYL